MLATTAPHLAMRILIVDDHLVVREGLRRILDASGINCSLMEAGDAQQALQVLRHNPFDLAIVDLSMPGMSGLELLSRVRSAYPGMRILVLSMHSEDEYVIRAFKAGANGYVTKGRASPELAAAVRKVAAGGRYVSADLAELLVLEMSRGLESERHAELSSREFDVLRRLVAGQRPTEIANAMHLSVKTVSTHKARVLERLRLPNLAALIRYGLERGLGNDDAICRGDSRH